MPSVVQEWVSELPLKLQTAMFCALRGCDGISREDVVKTLVRGIRKMVLLPSKPTATEPGGFMHFKMEELGPAIDEFAPDIARYPTHYIHHLLQACEVLGYFHPIPAVRQAFYYAYHAMVKELDLYPESADQCMERAMR